MNYEYQVKRTRKRGHETELSSVLKGDNALGQAMRTADHWKYLPTTRGVSILRADTEGINAGKFFLHLIVK